MTSHGSGGVVTDAILRHIDTEADCVSIEVTGRHLLGGFDKYPPWPEPAHRHGPCSEPIEDRRLLMTVHERLSAD